MEDPAAITSREELDARLESLRLAGGWPADFEDALTALAEAMTLPVGWSSLLAAGRVGVTAYAGLPDVPTTTPPEFRGRSEDDLPAPPLRTDGDPPRRTRGSDESVLEYGEHLGEALAAALVAEGIPRTVDLERTVAGYVQVLALDELRPLVAWERSLDAHALCMLTAERTLRHLGVPSPGADEEEACFRWLHLATYAEVTPAHLREQAARRALRLAHARQPAGAVAVMTSEISPGDALRYQQLVGSAPDAAFTPDQLRATLDRLATEAQERRRWAVRRDAYAELGHVDLTGSAQVEGPDYDAHLHGHLLRWLVEGDVPVTPTRLGWSRLYTRYLAEMLVHRPATKGRTMAPVEAHLKALHLMRRREGSIPLGDELVLLAWLMDQRGLGIRLAALLAERRRWLARLAEEARRRRDEPDDGTGTAAP